MTKTVKLKDVKTLVEYKGDFYTPEELAEMLGVTGDFEVRVNADEDNWFNKALSKVSKKTKKAK